MFNHDRMIAGQNKIFEQLSYDCNSSKIIFSLITFFYQITSSGPEDVGRMGTNFTRGRRSDSVKVRIKAERATLSEPYRSSSSSWIVAEQLYSNP